MKKIAYIMATIVFYLVATFLLFVMIFSILSYLEYNFGMQIPFVEIIENRPKVKVPFLNLSINIPLNYSIIIMWVVIAYYIFYLHAFKEFLKVFIKEKIFKETSLKHLRFFLKLNIIPLIYIIIFSTSLVIKGATFRLHDDYFIVFAHLVISFVVYLYLDVFKKGMSVQEENDLTI